METLLIIILAVFFRGYLIEKSEEAASEARLHRIETEIKLNKRFNELKSKEDLSSIKSTEQMLDELLKD